MKDTTEVIAATGAAFYISIQAINTYLTTISLVLAIGFTTYKIVNSIYNYIKRK